MSWTLWIYVLVAAVMLVLYGVAVYVAWWALFHDRSAGRRRCPRCWHDLSYTPGMTCNECGYTAGRERVFARTRRRWSIAVLSMSACVALACWIYWSLADRSWTAYAPTDLLVATLPLAHDANGKLVRELSGRAVRGNLDSRQWATLLDRCARGDWWARPIDDRWEDKYAPLIIAGRSRIERIDELQWDVQVHERLLTIPPQVELSSRGIWPIGSEPHFHFSLTDWWPLGPPCRITVTPRTVGSEPEVFYRTGGQDRPWTSLSFSVPNVDPAARELVIEVMVERRDDPIVRATDDDDSGPTSAAEPTDAFDTPDAWRLMSKQVITVPLRFESSSTMAFAPVDSLELAEAAWQTFGAGIAKYGEGERPVAFYFNRAATRQTAFEGVAFGVHVDLLKGDRIARRLDMWWQAGPSIDTPIASSLAEEDPELLRQVDESEQWSYQITGDRELAMRAGDAEEYWSGQFTIPVRLRPARRAPTRRWWRPSSEQTEDDEQDTSESEDR